MLNYKTFAPMLAILFLLSFNQSILWNIKDALVITTSGAEVTPFIKVWAILPGAILFTFIFTKLSNRYSQEIVFYLMTSIFLLFYALFIFVIYPHHDQFHPSISSSYLENILPDGCKGLVSMYRHWTFTLFYVTCELWNTIVISLLFWSFANGVTLSSQARHFYSALSIVYNLAVVAAGMTSSSSQNYGSWPESMTLLVSIVIVSGVLAMSLFRWMNQKVGSRACETGDKRVEEKLSLRQSLLHVSKSTYLLSIGVIVIAYSLVINLAEVAWKDQLRSLYPFAGDYNQYIGHLQVFQGALAIFISLSMPFILRWGGWTKTALITPISMMACCLFFFGIFLFQDHLQDFLMTFIGISPLAAIVFFGSVQNCISKACKYSVFDTTKEMALIPLSYESKLKGKTAIDGLGARFGKSGSSIIHQGMLIVFTSVSASSLYVAIILLVAITLWIIATCYLGKRCNSY